jgi:hypothetical protein
VGCTGVAGGRSGRLKDRDGAVPVIVPVEPGLDEVVNPAFLNPSLMRTFPPTPMPASVVPPPPPEPSVIPNSLPKTVSTAS